MNGLADRCDGPSRSNVPSVFPANRPGCYSLRGIHPGRRTVIVSNNDGEETERTKWLIEYAKASSQKNSIVAFHKGIRKRKCLAANSIESIEKQK